MNDPNQEKLFAFNTAPSISIKLLSDVPLAKRFCTHTFLTECGLTCFKKLVANIFEPDSNYALVEVFSSKIIDGIRLTLALKKDIPNLSGTYHGLFHDLSAHVFNPNKRCIAFPIATHNYIKSMCLNIAKFESSFHMEIPKRSVLLHPVYISIYGKSLSSLRTPSYIVE